ncbi:hypothetical protein D3C76_1434400 [compost metagenome]
MTDICRITHQLQENASDLLPANQDIIGPFKPYILYTERLQGAHYRQSHHQAQPLKLAHAAIHT